MKKIYLLLLFITSISFSQTLQNELNLDNNLTCNTVQTNAVNNVGVIYSGNNSIALKKTSVELVTTYNYLTNTQNELNQKTTVSHKFGNQQLFATHQFSSSFIRQINSDNWIGVGYGFKENIKSVTTSLSYATIYQYTAFKNDTYKEQFRHSVRARIKYEGQHVGVQTEYFYQPSFQSISNVIVYGTTKVTILPKNNISFLVQDIVNYNSTSSVPLVHTMTFGIVYKFNKKF